MLFLAYFKPFLTRVKNLYFYLHLRQILLSFSLKYQLNYLYLFFLNFSQNFKLYKLFFKQKIRNCQDFLILPYSTLSLVFQAILKAFFCETHLKNIQKYFLQFPLKCLLIPLNLLICKKNLKNHFYF